jgi:hypothetical protein
MPGTPPEQTPDVALARQLAADAASMLGRAPSFHRLDPATQAALVGDLGTINRALGDPYALSLETPQDLATRRRLAFGRGGVPSSGPTPAQAPADGSATPTPAPRVAATETIAARAGALADEIDFPSFVAGLVHGTFDAIVDATIRQMEAFADLVSAVAKDVDRFTADNVTPNQVRDWLVQQYPADLRLEVPNGTGPGQPRLRAAAPPADGGDGPSPAWLADFGLEGEDLTDELVEEQLVPLARRTVGENRIQTLATMVLLGMSRVNVKDGRIAARVRFRAAARDSAHVDYAVSQDPGGGGGWGTRGAAAYDHHATMVSTVGVNVQADSDLKVELFGEVQINFVSETLPLDRFVDQAGMTLLQRNARWAQGGGQGPAPAGESAPALAAPPAAVPAPPAAVPPTAAPPAVPVPVPPPAAGTGG